MSGIDSLSELPVMIEPKLPRVTQISKIVVHEGACSGMDSLRITRENIGEMDVSISDRGDKKPTIPERIIVSTNAKFAGMKKILSELLNNEPFLRLIQNRPDDKPLTIDELKKVTGIYNQLTLNRLQHIFDHDIDPELFPYIFYRNATQPTQMPLALARTVENSELVRDRFAILFSNPQFRNQLAIGRNMYSEYTSEINTEIVGLINMCLIEMSRLPGITADEIKNARQYLENDFFNIKMDEWPQKTGAYSVLINMLDFTCKYIEIKSYDSIGQPVWFTASYHDGYLFKRRFRSYIEGVDKGEYILSLLEKVKEFYRTYFPQIFEDVPIERLRIEDPLGKDPRSENIKKNIEKNANGYFDRDDKEIALISGTVLEKGGKEAFEEMTIDPMRDPGKKALMGKRKVIDSVTMFHEYSHAIYEKLVRGKATSQPLIEKLLTMLLTKDLLPLWNCYLSILLEKIERVLVLMMKISIY